MSYRIEQDFKYVGNDYWRWWAWIEADKADMDRVKEVVWILHPSFPRTRITVKEKFTSFRLETAGWGIFLLHAEVVLENGDKLMLKHQLRLAYPEPSTTKPLSRGGEVMTDIPTSNRVMNVFLSYSAEDSRMAARLREGLKEMGMEVYDQTRIDPGVPWDEAVRRMILQADAVVGIVGGAEISPFVNDELWAAAAADKPSVVLVSRENSGAGLPDNIQVLKVDMGHLEIQKIAELLKPR